MHQLFRISQMKIIWSLFSFESIIAFEFLSTFFVIFFHFPTHIFSFLFYEQLSLFLFVSFFLPVIYFSNDEEVIEHGKFSFYFQLSSSSLNLILPLLLSSFFTCSLTFFNEDIFDIFCFNVIPKF